MILRGKIESIFKLKKTMTSKIRVLSDHTINKIAAGEVIENPASVVKELVENSLDAGATEIHVEIRGGGRQLIRITDDGCGMNNDDALLCLERHATSKIRSVEEIHDISTMGFRGEAIPSIASISKFTLLTRPVDEKGESPATGSMVIVDGGKLISCTPVACAPGTTIEIKSLFFNVPVRKKFLKSPTIDANEILKTVSLMALGYPAVKFHLTNDGKNMLSTPPVLEKSFDKRLKARIGEVIGQDFLENSVFLTHENQGFEVQGVVGVPGYTRHNRSGQYLFINQRAVYSPLVAYAVKDGYGTALPTGRHPTFVLHLSVPGGLVDVNVHPQKREVRLRQEPIIRDLIAKAIVSALHQQVVSTVSYNPSPPPDFLTSTPMVSPVFARAMQKQEEVIPSFKRPDHRAPLWSEQTQTTALITRSAPSVVVSQPVTETFEKLSYSTSPPPRVFATIPRYILLEAGGSDRLLNNASGVGGIVFIDQRGAHARILFEKLSQEAEVVLPQQTLLIPYTIETTPFESDALRAVLPTLNRMGLHIQEFGPRSFLIDAIPQIFGNSDIERLIADIIRDVGETHQGQGNDLLFQRERVKQISLAASRAAVTHDRRLPIEEAQSLINQLFRCEQPFQCPSGKSIVAQLTPADIAKLFQRG